MSPLVVVTTVFTGRSLSPITTKFFNNNNNKNNNLKRENMKFTSILLNRFTAFGWLSQQVESVYDAGGLTTNNQGKRLPITWENTRQKCKVEYTSVVFDKALVELILQFVDLRSILMGCMRTCRYWFLVACNLRSIWKLTISDSRDSCHVHDIFCLRTITKFSKQILERKEDFETPRERFMEHDLQNLIVPSQYPKRFKIRYDQLHAHRSHKKSSKRFKVLIRGDTTAGKTTILKLITMGGLVPVTETVDLKMKDEEKERPFQPFRAIASKHGKNAYGMVFVLDCSNHRRFKPSMDALFSTLNKVEKPVRKDFPLLILCNKYDKVSMDPSNCVTIREVEQYISKLSFIGRRPIHIQYTSSVTGLGLYEALDWLSAEIEAM